MADITDGSSGAAQGAQSDRVSTVETNSGFKGWLKGVFWGGAPGGDASETSETETKVSVPDLIELRNIPVEDVAIPKADIVSVAEDIDKAGLVQLFRDSGFSRLPVYKETLDTPIGFVHLKDFALEHGFNGESTLDVSALLRPLLFVPPSMPIGVLFQKMQNDRRHMALVIDEYGGVDGLVTIEDLIEQVVGEIEDEHDVDEDADWQNPSPGIYISQAKTPLEDFEEEIGFSLTEADGVDEEEIDTMGGLVFMLLGRVPVRGEVIEHPTGTVIEVIDSDPRRIKRLRVTLPEDMGAEDTEAGAQGTGSVDG